MGGKRKAKEQHGDGEPNGETKEQRKEKKRLKKEEKKKKKEEKKKRKRQSGSIGTKDDETKSTTLAATETTTAQHQQRDDGQSVFLRKKLHLTVSLLPAALKNVQMSVEDSLRSLILKFSDGIGGILMAFENVQILSDNKTGGIVGMILNELPHIHYQVLVDALVFVPTPGCTLTGDVTGSSFHSHVGLIVHQYFNASISAEHLREAGFAFDEVHLQWYRDDKDQQNPLSSNDRIEFVCEKLFESGGIISIEGTKPSLLQLKEE